MDVATLKTALLWCFVINYILLLFWLALAVWARGWVHGILARLFGVSAEQVNNMNLVGISLYKVGIILFNLVPFLALTISGR